MKLIEEIKQLIFNSSIKTNLLRLYVTIIIVMSSMLITLLLYSINLNRTYNKVISNFKSYNTIYYKINSIDKDIYMNITEQRPFNSKDYAATIEDINNALDNVDASLGEDEISISVEILKRTVKTMVDCIDETGLLIKNNSDYTQREHELDLIIKAKTLIKDSIQQLMALDLNYSQKRIDKIKNHYNIALSIIIILFILSIFMSIVLLLLVIKGVVHKINIVSDNADKLAKGDLSIDKINFSITDEFQVLAQSFNQMKVNINDYINQISSNEMKISTILNEMNDCVITTNSLGEIESCNYVVEKTFNYERSELLGKNINELIESIDFSLYHNDGSDGKELIKDAKVIDNKYQLQAVKKEGTVFPIELSYKEVKLDEYKVITFVIHDVTQHTEMERMKNEFVSTVSHELRTPLTSIRGALGLALSETLGKLPEKSKDLLNIANNNSIRLMNLINDILDLEKIKAGKMEFTFKEYEVMPLIEETIRLNEEYAKQYNVKYEITERLDDAFINVDKDKFIQVVVNLLSNAAKFSFENEIVKISVQRKKNVISISVINRGPGIPEESYSKIFESFSQVDSSDSRKKGGTGLGLNIARLIIKKMGGEIGFTSKVNEDTTFYFELPEIVKKSENKTVLICEDNKTTAFYIKSMFEQLNYNPDIALCAGEAIQLLNDKNYDLMTLDIMLPDKDGLVFLDELSNNTKTEDLPIIIISVSKPDPKIMKNNYRVIDWLEKSFDIEDLKKSVTKIMQAKNLNKIEILHIENDEDILNIINLTLRDIANVTGVKKLSDAKDIITKNAFDIIILDYVFPEGTSDRLIPTIKSGVNKNAKLIVFSAYEESRILANYVDTIFLKTNVSNEQFKNSIESFINAKLNV